MITEDGKWFVCDHPGCEAKIKNHYWGYVKAERWFFSKDGKGFCPIHVPEWVADWRKKGKKNKS